MAPERKTPPGDFAGVVRELSPYLGLGTTLAVTVGLLCAFGYWLDTRMETTPLFALAFGVVGVIVALIQFVRAASQIRSKSPTPPDPPNP
jgi:hypothetical protein